MHLILGMLAALLVAAPPAGVAAQTATSQTSPALPQGDDLTLADGAGNVLIGLTVRPAQPGTNTVLVHVLPLEGPAAAADVQVGLSINGRDVPLDFCSRSCRTADVTLVGGEHVDVVADGPTGGTVSFDLPSLPAPDGSELLQQVQDRMHRLRTFRTDEVLRPANLPLQTRYSFQAPDRMQMEVSNGYQAVWVGPTRYDRGAPDAPWRTENVGIALTVPSMIWDSRTGGDAYVGQHIVGTDTVDGVDAQVLTFLLQAGNTPLWFKLWVDTDGLVDRAEMRAQGHFMDHRNYDFDAPFTIEAPAA